MSLFPPMTPERREILRQQENARRELAAVQVDHVCVICDGQLGMWRRENGDWYLACMADREHEGFRRLHGQAEAYRKGEYVSPYVAQIIERKGRKRMSGTELAKLDQKGMLARVEMARFPQQLTREQKVMVANVAMTYGLDPLMGELTVYQGNPYVSIDGRYRKARETGLLDGVESRPATAEERKAWQIPDGDYFFRAEVYAKGTRRPFVGWGRVRAAETRGPRDPSKAGFRPLETNPQRMAEKRAEAQALRKAFGIPLPSFGGDASAPMILEVDRETGEVIEAGAPEPQETPQEADPGLPVEDGEEEASPPLAEPPLKNVNDLTRWAEERYGIKGPEVYRILGIKSSVDIGDLEDARAKVAASQEG